MKSHINLSRGRETGKRAPQEKNRAADRRGGGEVAEDGKKHLPIETDHHNTLSIFKLVKCGIDIIIPIPSSLRGCKLKRGL